MTIVRTKIRLSCFVNTNFTGTNFLTYFCDKNPKVRTKTKIGMLVNTTPGSYSGYKVSKIIRKCSPVGGLCCNGSSISDFRVE